MPGFAAVFPGQGSQSVSMMTGWGQFQARVDRYFEQASDILGLDLKKIVYQGPEEQLNQTEITQPAMLVSGVASYQMWCEQSQDRPLMMSGHSLGEYTALTCANSIGFEDAVKLVSLRGKLMQTAVPDGTGAMAAIIGLDDQKVIEICSSVEQGIVAAVNFNSPGQVVIAGNRESVEQAMVNAKNAGAKRALPLPVSVPSHCELMRPAAEQLAGFLAEIELQLPDIPVIHNQSAKIAESVDEIRDQLKLQLYSPVRWVECVQALATDCSEGLQEFGPGKVLTGLARRIDKSVSAAAIYDEESLLAASNK